MQKKGVNQQLMSMNSQKAVSDFYKAEINKLEKLYSENQSDDVIWDKFIKDLGVYNKLEITFDNRFSDTFRDYFKYVIDTFSGSEYYAVKVGWVSQLNKIMREHKFTSKRDFIKIQDQVDAIRASPSTFWLEQLPYLRSSSDIKEFRGEFLTRLCGLNDEDAENIAEEVENDSPEAVQRLKKEYICFFEQCLDENASKKISSFMESEWSRWQVKGEMLPADFVAKLDRHLGVAEVGSNANEVEVNKTLVEVAQMSLYQNDRDVQQRLDNEVELIEKALQKFSGLNIIKDKDITLHLGKFGSLISGFASTDADLDLTILTNSYVKEEEFLKVLQEFLRKEYQEGDRRSFGRKVLPELILTAKTPLITITISERGKKEIKIDLIVNNILGVINSKFLRVYAGVRWVKNLGILVKLWGKSVGLIDKKALSSYAMILMLIHYLIRAKHVKPILDARNRTINSPHFKFQRMKQGQTERFDVFYVFKDRIKDVSTVERVSYWKILEGFMRYYATDIWKENENNRIITVDQSTNKSVDTETVLTIKDPFDEPHNPGRLKIESKEFLIQKFKEAHTQLIFAKEDTKLTAEVRQERVKNLFNGY